MRIIAGKLKGSNLYFPTSKNTRPLKDMVRESIFNLLTHSNKLFFQLKNSNILDLYSGTGSFGLECLSRDSDKVTFVESSKNALKILRKNIDKLNVERKTVIIEESVFNYLSNINNFNYKQDLIFLDPPYKEQDIFGLINNIFKANILKKNGLSKKRKIFPLF